MWPFGRRPGRLAAALGKDGRSPQPTKVSVLATLTSPNAVVSPLSGMRAALILVEIVERVPLQGSNQTDPGDSVLDSFDVLGQLVLGDVVTLRDEAGDEIMVVAGRARIEPQQPRRGGTPLTRIPPELMPIVAHARGRGVVCYRELMVGAGDKLRIKATIEPSQSVVASGYRSGTRLTYVARDDLSPVVLEEVFDMPSW